MKRPGFTICGHRGAMGDAPENTLTSFYLAVEQKATMIELDVRLSRDGQWIVIHDATVDRTTDGTGKVSDLTWPELKELDAGGWFGDQYAGERIPRLEDVFDALSEDVFYNIEIKSEGVPSVGMKKRLLDLIDSRDLVDRVAISSFEPVYLRNLRRLHQDIQLALLYSRERPHGVQDTLEQGWQAIHPSKKIVTKDLIQRAHAHGLVVRAWTVNEADEMRHLIESGVDCIITDYPQRLYDVAVALGRMV